ncbi:hypothetical protein GF345_06085 [Candidatus Woesearchaeota archaeon]|nr:hypothetical protein [Candidatus Woesearchaeota archaeon]
MKNILVLGALPKDEERIGIYKSIASVCKEHADNISTPIETAGFKGTEKERYERAFQKVREADLIIGELSEPSTGQGMEIMEAANLNKPVVILALEGSKVSGLVRGCPAVKKILFYNDKGDLKKKLEKHLTS